MPTYTSLEPGTQNAGLLPKVCLGMGAGFVCGMVAVLAVNNTASSSTMAYTLVQPATHTISTTPVPTVRSTTYRAAQDAAEPVQFAGPRNAAPLDPLRLAGSTAQSSSWTWAGAIVLPVVSLALAIRAFWNQKSSAVPQLAAEQARLAMATVAVEPDTEGSDIEAPTSRRGPTPKSKKSKFSKRRQALEAMYEAKKLYPAEEAIQMVKESANAGFVEGVDVAVSLNINPRKSDQMLRGSVVLPGGTGKVVRVAAFCTGDNIDKAKAAGAEFVGAEDLADLIKGGEMGFDVVVATPDAMRVALQLGRILGPRGLMPNPKDGTVSPDIEAAITQAKAGQVKYRSDKAGVVHVPIGKADFDDAALLSNLNAIHKEIVKMKPASVKGVYMKKLVLSSTMGIGIYVDTSTLEG